MTNFTLYDEYTLKSKDNALCFRYHLDFESGTGFDIQIVLYGSCQIAVSIYKIGHFVFRGWDAILGMKSVNYVGEKLCITKPDAEGMVKFFEWFYNTDMPTCYRMEAWNDSKTS